MFSFKARYSGPCGYGDWIHEDEEVIYEDDELVHVKCQNEAHRESKAETNVCQRCWTVLPLSGICGTCEE